MGTVVNGDLNGRRSRERPKGGGKAKFTRLFVAALRPIPLGSTKKNRSRTRLRFFSYDCLRQVMSYEILRIVMIGFAKIKVAKAIIS